MLFLKECKKIIFSITFLIYIITVTAFYFTQFSPELNETLSPPSQNQEDYGDIAKEVPEILMPSAVECLVKEYLSGEYTAYPMGFVKHVKLSDKKKTRMAEIITELTGITKSELDNFKDFDEGGMIMTPDGNGGYVPVLQEPHMPEINIPDSMTYEHFRKLMKKADKIIGGGSKYSDEFIVDNFSRVPKTYEDSLAEYNDFIEKDKITGAYARLFCDYIGIIVSILPVFVSAVLVNYDRKSRIEQLIYSRKISSAKLVLTRYTAIISVLSVPVIILSVIATAGVNSLYPDNKTDIFAIFRLSVCWLIPNIMISSSVGMLLTEIFSPLIAIFAQGVWWVSSVMNISNGLSGDIRKFTLVCRHNSLYGANLFEEDFSKFIFNRIFYTVLSVILIIISSYIYSRKRKGDFHVSRKNNMRKSKA